MSTDHAYEAGRYARQAARGRDTCPRYGITPHDRQQADRWRQGWDDQDNEMAARRTTSPSGTARMNP